MDFQPATRTFVVHFINPVTRRGFITRPQQHWNLADEGKIRFDLENG